MRKLIEGVSEYQEKVLPYYERLFQQLAHGQQPHTLFISCSDSRVVPNLFIAADPGDLFAVRNVGNLIPSAGVNGASIGNVSEASAIEYALIHLQVSNIVLCGHSGCGAMKAVISDADLTGTPNLAAWLKHAQPAAARFKREVSLDPSLAPHDQLAQINVLVQLENLMSYPVVRSRVETGQLRLSGWWFEIPTGGVYIYDRRGRRFELIDQEMAERLLAQIEKTENF